MCTSTCLKWKQTEMERQTLQNDLEHFRSFLNEFCEKLKDKDDEIEYVPVRLANPRVTPEELEGECLEWCLNFLSTRQCPQILAAHIAHEVYEHISNSDLDLYVSDGIHNGSSRLRSNQSNNGQNEVDSEKEKKDENEDEKEEKKTEEIVIEYSAEKLQKLVNSTLEEVCTSFLSDMPEIILPSNVFDVSFHAIKNTRRKMEDSHVIAPDLNGLFGLKDAPPQSFYGVFDGHAGIDASLFSSKHIHCNLVRRCSLDKNPGEANKSAFKVTDDLFVPKAKRERWRSGSTGVTAHVRGNKLYMTWLGDSQAVLVRDGRAVTHMEPHKPDRQDERDRIEAQGGFVMLMGETWRVGGNIAVSRAIGDAAYKPFISSEAEVLAVDLDGTEDYLVLACDGLWDVVVEEDLPRLVYDAVSEAGGDLSTVARSLVQYAKVNDSLDNISVIVVFFRENISEPKADTQLFNFLSGNSQGANQSGADSSDRGNNSDCSGDRGNNSGSKRNNSNNPETKGGQSDSVTQEHCSNKSPRLLKSEIMWDDINRSLHQKYKEDAHRNKHNRNLDDVPIEQDVDLDYYGVFDTRVVDGPVDLSFMDDQNSSILLKDIADSVYRKRFSNNDLHHEENMLSERRAEIQRIYQDSYFAEHHDLKKKVKKQKGVILSEKKKYNKKGLASSPICWAFTGKNRATVQNHRLNRAAKAANKGSNLTPGELNLAARAPPSLPDKSMKFAQHYTSSENVNLTSQTLAHGILESLPPPKPKIASKQSAGNKASSANNPGLTVFGSKNSIQTDSQKFHSSWRPRKPLKPISSVVYEMPPTPFINSKLSVPREH